jgi:protein involved in polysaccharide export with SLBB domain
MRTLLLVAVAIQPLTVLAQSSFPSSPTTPPELEVPVRRASPVVRPASAVSAPASTGGIQSGATFRVGDSFELRLSGMPPEDAAQYAQPFTIGSDGYLSIPLAGPVKAAGLTTNQLERAIERKLIDQEIFRFPTATIYVGGAQVRFVTIGGQVRSPNRLPWSSDLTLLAALSAAGGGGDFAGDKIALIREGKVSIFSIKRLNKDPSQDPRLLPGDRVELK